MSESSIFKKHVLYEIEGKVLEFLFKKKSTYIFFDPIRKKRVLKKFGKNIRSDIRKIGKSKDFPEYYV